MPARFQLRCDSFVSQYSHLVSSGSRTCWLGQPWGGHS